MTRRSYLDVVSNGTPSDFRYPINAVSHGGGGGGWCLATRPVSHSNRDMAAKGLGDRGWGGGWGYLVQSMQSGPEQMIGTGHRCSVQGVNVLFRSPARNCSYHRRRKDGDC